MRKSILGEVFGKLKIVGYDGIKNKNSYWLCECECGNKVSCCRCNLVGGKQQSCGWSCEAVYSLIDEKFGKLQVKKRAYMKNGTSYWLCLCECGQETTVKRSHLTSHHVGSCGCSRRGKSSHNWSGCGELSGSLFNRIRHHARRRKIQFNIEIDYLWELFQKQNGRCALSGLILSLPKHQLIDCTASLDRIDSSLGYTKENVQWVHKDVNFMKQRFSQDYFLGMCKNITEHTLLKLSIV